MPNQSEINPRGQHRIKNFNTHETFSEQVKSIVTLRNGKVVEQRVEIEKIKINEKLTESEPTKK